jgi:hypothetical protein
MPVYVDKAVTVWRGQRWCHLLADTLAELHAFAAKIGSKPEWFQSKAKYPHYDMNEKRRELAVKLGAIEVDRKTIILKARKLKEEAEQLNAE